MNLFIGCSSKNEILPKYEEDCKNYLKFLLKDNDLVFGADNTGLMGLSHDIASKHNKNIIGICPKRYKSDFNNLKCTTEITTNSTIERINMMIENSDALIFLPGGIGTLAELFVSLDSKRCHEIERPMILYNSLGVYDDILIFLDKLCKEGFITNDVLELLHISNSAEDTLNYIEEYYNKNDNNKRKIRIKK